MTVITTLLVALAGAIFGSVSAVAQEWYRSKNAHSALVTAELVRLQLASYSGFGDHAKRALISPARVDREEEFRALSASLEGVLMLGPEDVRSSASAVRDGLVRYTDLANMSPDGTKPSDDPDRHRLQLEVFDLIERFHQSVRKSLRVE